VTRSDGSPPPWVTRADDPALVAFHTELCAFLRESLDPARLGSLANPRDRTGLAESFERELQRAAGARGYLGVSLPTEFGGEGQSALFGATFAYEAAYHDAPLVDTAVTLAAGPMIRFGNDHQVGHLLPLIVKGEIEMCIGYTEPAAGNDLASLQATAVRDGDDYLLSGVKSLLTGADKADYCLTVARTDPDVAVRSGMTMFVVDMHLPGVSTAAQPTMAGYDLWEVHFDEVRVPATSVLGVEGEGWGQLLNAIEAERTAMFSLGTTQRIFDTVLQLVTTTPGADGELLLADPVVADRVLQLWLDLQVAHRFSWRPLLAAAAGRPARPAAGSIAKVTLTELMHRLADEGSAFAGTAGVLAGQLFGPVQAGAAVDGRLAFEFMFRFDGPVSVGTNEIHRTGIARTVLRVPRPDRSELVSGRTWEEIVGEHRLEWRAGVLMASPPDRPATFSALVELTRELGRSQTSTPIQNGVVLAAALIGSLDDSVRSTGHLDAVLTATRGYAVALGGRSVAAGSELTARRTETGWTLTGQVLNVPGADTAEVLLVVASVQGVGPSLVLLAVDATTPGLLRQPVTTISGQALAHLAFDAVEVMRDAELASGVAAAAAIESAVALARVTLCAEIVGAGTGLLEATIERVGSRVQFGAPLASLPAVQQRLADMVIDHAAAEDALAHAVERVERGESVAGPAVEAQLICARAAGRVAAGAHQLWGGTGYLTEAGLHRWTAFIKSVEGQYGAPHDLRRELLRTLWPSQLS
jgi:3-oxocholest-4-en-26-oyl-CoA dehydrogenase alpha subunit